MNRLAAGTILLAVLAAVPALGFELQSHRGGRGLWPENSLPSPPRSTSASRSWNWTRG